MTRGRPRRLRDFQCQYQRNPVQCQPTTVSGLTTISTFFPPDQRRLSTTQNSRFDEFTRPFPFEYCHLLPESENLESETGAGAEESAQPGKYCR